MDRIALVKQAEWLLVTAALRAWRKPKNARKIGLPDLTTCVACLRRELEEVEEALGRGHVDDVIDELGDVAAWCGLTLWRAVTGEEP